MTTLCGRKYYNPSFRGDKTEEKMGQVLQGLEPGLSVSGIFTVHGFAIPAFRKAQVYMAQGKQGQRET